MSFSCKNYNYDNDSCRKLKSDCIPGRKGCVLEGKVKLSKALESRIADLEAKRTSKKN